MTDTVPLEPLSLDEVKTNLRIDGVAEDDLVDGLIVDAREYVERATGLVLVPRTVTETAPALAASIELSAWPVSDIVAVRYPVGGVMTALAPGAWQVSFRRRPVRLLPATPGWGVGAWAAIRPALPVEIDIAAGYADPADVPRAATRAMHMLIAHWYSNRATAEVGARAASIEVPFGVNQMLQQLQLQRV